MKAIVLVERKKLSIVFTEISNIDWEDKSIIDNYNLEEKEYLADEIISVYDTKLKKSLKVLAKKLCVDTHQLLIDKKLYIPLHIIN